MTVWADLETMIGQASVNNCRAEGAAESVAMGGRGCDTEMAITPVVCQKKVGVHRQNGMGPFPDGSRSIPEDFGSNQGIHAPGKGNAVGHCAQDVPVILMIGHTSVMRPKLRYAARDDGRTKSRRNRAIPSQHEMRFVPDELQIVETHFFDPRIEGFGYPLEMLASVHVVEWIDESHVRCVQDVDIVKDLVSSKMVRGKQLKDALG